MDYIRDSIDLMRLTFLLGAVLALVYKKKIGVTPGGIIVPGLLACVLVSSFKAFLLVLATSLLCWIIYKLTFAKYALSQRSSSLALMSLSVFLCIGEIILAQKFTDISQELQLFSMVVPGLITIGAKKYGLGPVMQGTLITTAATFIVGVMIASLIPTALTSYLSTGLGSYHELELAQPLVSFAISISVAALLYVAFKVRSGGYLMAPFLAALIAVSPVQSIMVLIGTILSFLIVKFILAKSLVVGLERFVVSLFCGYFVITLCDYIAIALHLNNYYPSTLTLIIAVAVLTNDLTLQPLKKAIGKGIAPAVAASYAVRLVV